jgi:hypothetical protein
MTAARASGLATGSCEEHTIAASLFSGIECGVGSAHNFIAAGAVFGKRRDAGADRHHSWNSGKLPALDHPAQFLGYSHRMLGIRLYQ